MSPSPSSAIAAAAGAPAAAIRSAGPSSGGELEREEELERDGPKLRRIPARVRFYSMEPLLEDVDCYYAPPPDWIIVGGESGRNARPMAEQWCLKIARYCEENNVPMFMKQGSAANWPHWKEFDRWHAELRVREFPLLREDA